MPPEESLALVLILCTGGAFWLNGWTETFTVAVALPPRPSSASYVKDVDPVAPSGTSICKA